MSQSHPPLADALAPGRLDAAPAAPDASPWTTFWIASVAVFLVSMDATILYAAFGAIRTGFPGSSAADLSWVLNGYTVVYAALLIPAGGLADTYGRKRLFLVGVLVFVLASAACGLAPGVGTLVAARVAQAVGAALLTPASLSMVLAAFPAQQRTLAVSLWGAVGGLAAAVGPGLGSMVVDSVGWPWAFFLNLPPGLWAAWRGRRLLRESVSGGTPRRLDLVGMALLVTAVGSVALALVESESPRWSGQEIAGVAGAGVAAGILFLLWARRAADPLVDLKLFRFGDFLWANLATLSFGIAFAMMFFGFFFHLTGVWGYGLTAAGLAVMPGPLTVVAVAMAVGRLAARHGYRPFLLGGCAIYAFTGLWFWWVPGDRPEFALAWLPGMLLSGLSVGLILPSLAGAAVRGLPAQHFAVGSAVNQATRQIGGVLGVALIVMMLGEGRLTHADFTSVYVTQIGLAVLTGLLCLRLQRAVARA